MSVDRKEGRRKFRPELDGHRLEDRVVMSRGLPYSVNHFLLTHPQIGYAYKLGRPAQYLGSTANKPHGQTVYNRGYPQVQTIAGGAGVQVATADGSHFRITLQLADNTYDGGLTAQTGSLGTGVLPNNRIQPIGTIRAYPTPGNKIGLIVDGTTSNMSLVIDRLPFPQRRGYAHSFAYGQAGRTHILDLSSINITSGQIGQILGFQTANLSGPLTIGGTTTVDRIALNNLLPGASIGVGGSVNSLEIFGNATLTSGKGISVAGDLNLLNVGQDLTLTNGASLDVQRFLGLVPQPPKGSGTGSNIIALNQALIGSGGGTLLVPGVSGYVKGNVNVGPGSVIRIGSGIANSSILGQTFSAPAIFLINGSLNAEDVSQFEIPGVRAGTELIRAILPDGTIVYNNIVARNGVNVPGV